MEGMTVGSEWFDELESDSTETGFSGLVEDSEGGITTFSSSQISSSNFDGGIPVGVVNAKASELKVGDYIYWDPVAKAPVIPTPPANDDDAVDGEIDLEDQDIIDSYDEIYMVTDINYDGDGGDAVNYTISLNIEEEMVDFVVKGSTSITCIREDWDGKEIGTQGWMISSSGNAIFSNIAARGTIEATSGYMQDMQITGVLDVNGSGNDDESTTAGAIWVRQNPAVKVINQPSIVMNNLNGFVVRRLNTETQKIEKAVHFPLNSADPIIISGFVGEPEDGDTQDSSVASKDKLIVGGKNKNVTIDGGAGNKAIYSTIAGVKTNLQNKNGFRIGYNPDTDKAVFVVGSGSTQYMTFDGNNLNVSGNINASTLTMGGGDNALNFDGSNLTISGTVYATDGSFTGTIYAENGEFGGSLTAATGTFTGALQAATGDFTGAVTATELHVGGANGINYDPVTGIVQLGGSQGITFDPDLENPLITLGTDVIVSGGVTAESFDIDSFNYWNTNNSGDFRVGDAYEYIFWNQDPGELEIKGDIIATSGEFTGDVYLTGVGRLIAQGTSGNEVYLNSDGITGLRSGIPTFYLPSDGSPPIIGGFQVVNTGLITPDSVTANIYGNSGETTITVSSPTGTIYIGMALSGTGIGSGALVIGINGTTISLSVANTGTVSGTGNFTPTSNLIVGTLQNNITVRGQTAGGAKPAIFSVISGINTTQNAGDGFYVGQDGAFRFAQGTNVISGSGGSLSITGTINAKAGSFEGYMSSGSMRFGTGVQTGKNGIWVDSSNYWYSDNNFRIGGSTGISYTGSGTVKIGSNTEISGSLSAATGTFAGSLQAATGTFTSLTATNSTKALVLDGTNAELKFRADTDANYATISSSLAAGDTNLEISSPTLYVSANDSVRISAGYVGIHSTGPIIIEPGPDSFLDVNGELRGEFVSASTFAAGGGWVGWEGGPLKPSSNLGYNLGISTARWNNLFVGTVNESSDANLKTDIKDIGFGLNFIMSLRPVSYKWKEAVDSVYNDSLQREETVVRPGIRNHYGFLAQEVRDVAIPLDSEFGAWYLADKYDENSEQSLSYSQFIAPIVKAIQELNEKLENIQERLAILEG